MYLWAEKAEGKRRAHSIPNYLWVRGGQAELLRRHVANRQVKRPVEEKGGERAVEW